MEPVAGSERRRSVCRRFLQKYDVTFDFVDGDGAGGGIRGSLYERPRFKVVRHEQTFNGIQKIQYQVFLRGEIEWGLGTSGGHQMHSGETILWTGDTTTMTSSGIVATYEQGVRTATAAKPSTTTVTLPTNYNLAYDRPDKRQYLNCVVRCGQDGSTQEGLHS